MRKYRNDAPSRGARQGSRTPIQSGPGGDSPRTRAVRWAGWGLLCGLSGLLPATARADALGGLAETFEQALSGGSMGVAMVMAFAAGIATALTPCVYPMIAITVSVFGARQVQSRAEGALLSTAFVGGMAVLFTGLGVLAALTGGVFGTELGNPWVAGGIALLFIALALSMFGAFELALPSGLTTRLSEMGGIGYRGAFVLGMVSSLIAAPCVGPVLGLLLPWVGTTGNVTAGALYMFAYAVGLGSLFWVVGTFAVSLPKSGRWMEAVKSVFGLVMLVSALYFVRRWLPGYEAIERHAVYLGAGLAALAVGLLMGAVHLSFHDGTLARARKATGVLTATVGLLLAIGYLEAAPAGAEVAWREDLASARAQALAEQRPLLVDFGADWCGACGELERKTFSHPQVREEMDRFVRVKVDLSGDNQTGFGWLADYGAQGLPLVVVHDPRGEEAARVTEFIEPEPMLELLRGVN